MVDINQIFRRFTAIWADSQPIRTLPELRAAVRAAELAWADVTDDWLRSLDPRWVYRQSDEPFADTRRNEEYRRRVQR
ncbi:MAG: hypothetical protein IT379_15510 [Deltaproteobacteria bacterium]|nr:hypothetical protein [Deltaproteobacteria bacterium]